MNIFLTGQIQVGKTTIINKVINMAPSSLSLGGFRTSFGPDRFEPGKKYIYMYSAAEDPKLDYAHAVAVKDAGERPEPIPGRFDELGPRYLNDEASQNCDLLIADECGMLEKDAKAFEVAMLSALDGDKPILGVVRGGLPGWTRAIADHSKTLLIEVTEQNRDQLPAEIFSKLFEK